MVGASGHDGERFVNRYILWTGKPTTKGRRKHRAVLPWEEEEQNRMGPPETPEDEAQRPNTPGPRAYAHAYFARNEQLTKDVERHVLPLLRAVGSADRKQRAAVLIYDRMFLWMSSLAALNHPNHFQAAAAAARSLIE